MSKGLDNRVAVYTGTFDPVHFGHLDVIDRIGETPTGAVGQWKSDAPLKAVVIQKMEILAPGAATNAPPVTPVATPQQNTILSPK